METQAVVQTMGGSKPVAQRCLVRKLAEVMGQVGMVPKSGTNAFHGYKYATEADIVAAVRQGMAQRSLMLIPDVERTDWREGPADKSGKAKRICSLTVRFVLEDGDSGETREFRVMGEGDGSDDKATYKAMTGAIKYALLKLFLIPTGDDPEKDEGIVPAGAVEETRQKIWKADAPTEARPAGGGYTIKFGSSKGKTLPELTDADLAWHHKKAAEDVAKNDAKWHAKNLEALRAMDAEIARRKSATPPAAPSGSDTAAAAARLRINRIFDGIKSLGVSDSKEALGGYIGRVLGNPKPSKDWTSDDMTSLESSIKAERAPDGLPHP